MNKQEIINLAITYINNNNCYPAAKGWTIKSAGCSRDKIYKLFGSWSLFIDEVKQQISIPGTSCITTPARIPDKEVLSKKCCLYCNKFINIKNKYYCSQECDNNFRYTQRVKDFTENKYQDKLLNTGSNRWFRKFLISQFGESCSECGIGNTYNNKDLTLEVDHIDGKAKNNKLSNLRFLCLNCHSQTDTYRAKNKNSDRIR